MDKQRILFVSEDITLAQVVRLVQLAKCLDRELYEVHFACSDFKKLIFQGTDFIHWKIDNIGKDKMQDALDESRPIYAEDILEDYVQDELNLIKKVKPDFIIGDFRLSLSISAPLSDIRFAVLINAYWSPYTNKEEYPIPDHNMVHLLGENLAQYFFNLARPVAFAQFARPVNSLRKKYGLRPIGSLLETLTFGDFTLHPDTPGLVPTQNPPQNHIYLGPVLWSPQGDLRLSEEDVKGRPIIYLTLGSSGKVDILPKIIEALGGLPVYALVATAGRKDLDNVPENILIKDFIPGSAASSLASLVICNGGSTTGYQALYEGVPILGIASNLDQYLAMSYITNAGAGKLMRAGRFKVQEFHQNIMDLLDNPTYKQAAKKIQEEFRLYNYKEIFNDVLEKALQPKEANI
ncbi:MAG: glycosyl transferase family 1 [Bacteroidota bacterium]|nr:glycosyl transferase family 1 [Bacteroidota bacterium]